MIIKYPAHLICVATLCFPPTLYVCMYNAVQKVLARQAIMAHSAFNL